MNHVNFNVTQIRNKAIAENNSHKNVHDHLKNLSVMELAQITHEHTFPFWVMCLNLYGELNIGTIIRSSHLMGAERVIVLGRRTIDKRGLVGAANYTPVDKMWGVDENGNLDADVFECFCVENKVAPILIEQGGVNCFEFDWRAHILSLNGKKPMLVVGSENGGIAQSVLDLTHKMNMHVVSIPQRGVIRSHNCSMAFSIVASQMISNMAWY